MSDPRSEPGSPGSQSTTSGDNVSLFATLELQTPAPLTETETDTAGHRQISAAEKFELVLEVPVTLSVELGRTEISIGEILNFGRGSLIELDRTPGTPLDVRINGVLIGRGEVVLVNEERLGLRFVEVVSQAERMKRLG